MKHRYIIAVLAILIIAGIAIAEIMPDGVTECHFEDFYFACSDNNVYGSMEQAIAAHPAPTPDPTPALNQIVVEVSNTPQEVVVGNETLIISAGTTTTLTIQY